MTQGSGKADGSVGRRVRPVAHALATLRRRLRNLLNIREGRASYLVIRRRFVNGARLDGTHLCILVVAMLIACIGLNTNSTEAIVGAMRAYDEAVQAGEFPAAAESYKIDADVMDQIRSDC